MQKKLLTIAVAGALAAPALAFAQASGVEVYGTVNMAFGQFKYTDGNTARIADTTTAAAAAAAGYGGSKSAFDVANGASNYGVRSRENLGGGMSGWIQIEQNAPLERSNNQTIKPASRNSAIGLDGGFGNFFMGQWTTPWADLDSLWGIGTVGFWGPVTSIIGRRETTGAAPNYACTNLSNAPGGGNPNTTGSGTVCDPVQGAGGVGHPFWRRTSQSIFYQSPVMSGVQVKLSYQTDEGKSIAPSNQPTLAQIAANAWMYSSSVQWSGMGGRARVGLAYDGHHDFTTPGKTDTGYAIKGGWNFGVVDIGFAYEAMSYKCGVIPFTAVSAATGAAGSNTPTLPALCNGEGDIKAKQYALAFAVPVGPGSIRGSYSVAKDLTGSIGTATVTGSASAPVVTTTGSIGDTGAKQYNIGYEHRFSKRTNIGIGYAKIDNKQNAQFTWTGTPPAQDGRSTPLFGSDVSTFFLSMTHRF
jgi:predicted porin